jgi:TrmH family RNA methyltransferase
MKIEQITSRDNRRLVEARKVRDGKATDRIFIEGRRLVEEALRSDIGIEECYFSDDFSDDRLRSAFHGHVYELPSDVFRSLAATGHPQGIVVVAKRPETDPHKLNLDTLIVFLNEINNPANLGAVIRTAEAAGIGGMIVSMNSADVFSPKALRASMGSAFRVPIWEGVSFDEVVAWARRNALVVTAADLSGSIPYTEIDWTQPRLLIFGSEAHGLDPTQLRSVDETVTIPMENAVESLNLAVSAGVILFEAKRQRSN